MARRMCATFCPHSRVRVLRSRASCAYSSSLLRLCWRSRRSIAVRWNRRRRRRSRPVFRRVRATALCRHPRLRHPRHHLLHHLRRPTPARALFKSRYRRIRCHSADNLLPITPVARTVRIHGSTIRSCAKPAASLSPSPDAWTRSMASPAQRQIRTCALQRMDPRRSARDGAASRPPRTRRSRASAAPMRTAKRGAWPARSCD